MLDNAHVVRGRSSHSGTGRPRRSKTHDGQPRTMSLEFEDAEIGVHGKADWVEETRDGLLVVEKKRGQGPQDGGAWPNDRVQAAITAICLKKSGRRVAPVTAVFYEASNRRVEVPLDDKTQKEALDAVAMAQETALAPKPPDPPETLGKRCMGCSLVPICLPFDAYAASVRPRRAAGGLVPGGADEPQTVYVDQPGSYVSVRGDHLVINTKKNTKRRVPLQAAGQVVVTATTSLSAAVLAALARLGVPLHVVDFHGRYAACSTSAPSKDIFLRSRQYELFTSPTVAFASAAATVHAKIANQRAILLRHRRNHPARRALIEPKVKVLRTASKRLRRAADISTLRGIEGNAARAYFSAWRHMLSSGSFDWNGRNKRPPRDPVNAALSFAYSLLAKESVTACLIAGLDPYMGFYHADRFGRPSLALDIMEPYRPVIADSVVLTLFNNRRLAKADFLHSASGCYMSERGRKAFYAAYEQRLSEKVRHPTFRYRISYRRCLELEARLVASFLRGDLKHVSPFIAR